MPTIILETRINAPIGKCFDLARSIDLHMKSMEHTEEKAVAGVTSGLIGLGETVTWKARHFGIIMRLTSRITKCDYPSVFEDKMVSGAFHSFRHTHQFLQNGNETIMNDEFDYKSPFGFLGMLADFLFLKAYMRKLLEHRNRVLKQTAESNPDI